MDFYSRTSRDLLMQMEDTTRDGLHHQLDLGNVGKVRNTGIELQVNTVNIQTKDLTWTTSLTFAHNRNKILETQRW